MRTEHLDLLSSCSTPRVSPDGRLIALVVSRVDSDANGYRSQIWLASADGSRAARPLTAGTNHDREPVWSPDGRLLAFVSARSDVKGAATIHVLAVDGPGETVTVAVAKGGASELAWSPDGRWLAYTSDAVAPDAEDDPAKQPPRRIERFFTRLDDKGWTHDRPTHVFVVRADGSGRPRDLTPGPHLFAGPSWLADSSGVVAHGADHEDWDRGLEQDLFVVPLDGERRRLTGTDGNYILASVSPDGRHVAFLGFPDATTGGQIVRLGVLELATGESRWLDPDLQRSCAPFPGVQAPQWDGNSLVTSYEDRGDTKVRRVSLDPGVAPATVSRPGQSVTGFSYANGTLAVTVTTFDRPAELAVIGRDASQAVLTSVADEFVAEARPQDAHRFTSPSAPGIEVDTWVTLPPGVDPADSSLKLPVLLNVHGGPLTQYGNKFFDEAQMQAAAGYVVVMCNPRGSSGRDNAWGQAILGPKHPVVPGTGWGSVDVDDVLAALDEALRRFPCADPERVGMLGGSYGGYMASWLAGHTNRFKALCSERAVNNMVTMEFTSDVATYFTTETGADHLDDPDELMRMSPITYVRQIETPILIMHSEDDLRCPISQAEELFVALRKLRKPVEFLRFPAESHELSRSGSPAHRKQRQEAIVDFFDRNLKM